MKIIYSLVILFFCLGCGTQKGELKTIGDEEDAIINSIQNFKHSRLFRRGTFFVVFCRSIDDDLFEVSIMEDSESKFLFSKNKKLEENRLPSKSFEVSDKLFVWWSKNEKIDYKTFLLLQKYNMLQDDENGQIKDIDYQFSEKKKVAYYYICKKDLSNFQRIITNRSGMKYNIQCR